MRKEQERKGRINREEEKMEEGRHDRDGKRNDEGGERGQS